MCSRELPAGVPSTLENKAGGALKNLKLLTEGRDKVPQTAASVSGPCVLPGGSATVSLRRCLAPGASGETGDVMWCDVMWPTRCPPQSLCHRHSVGVVSPPADCRDGDSS